MTRYVRVSAQAEASTCISVMMGSTITTARLVMGMMHTTKAV